MVPRTELIAGIVLTTSSSQYRGYGRRTPVLDLDYAEDSGCDTDMNVVMTGAGGFVEVQGTAEGAPFSRDEMDTLVALAASGIRELIAAQRAALQA
jgi:ribonuclease PH